MRDLAVVIPVYNGSNTIGPLVEEVFRELSGRDVEIVLVNDGSKDSSHEVCAELTRRFEAVKLLSLRRNFGEHNAVMCGLNHTDARYVAIIDDDFQNPPSEILKLVTEAEKGFDVVYSKYHSKKHHWFRNFGSRMNDFMATHLLNKPPNLYLSTFKVIKGEVVAEVIKYQGPFPYVDGLLLRVTRNISSVYVEHAVRADGKSTYTFGKLLSVWLNMFLNFSIKPLRVFTFLGLMVFVVGLILSLAFIIEKLFYPEIALGWTSIIVSVLMLSGLQLIFLGLVGEYLGKCYLDQNGTPQWVIAREVAGGEERLPAVTSHRH